MYPGSSGIKMSCTPVSEKLSQMQHPSACKALQGSNLPPFRVSGLWGRKLACH